MSFSSISAGKNLPDDLYGVIEIPAHSPPIKYEVDKEMDALVVDRFMPAPMFYPVNYGYISETLADDGDPLDILIPTPCAVVPGAVVRCRPVGLLNMSDEKGGDQKIIAVPHEKLTPLYNAVHSYNDLPELLLQQIEQFFLHYKNLEKDKWVKVDQWQDKAEAQRIITQAFSRYQERG